jgi:hypothetical protein
MQITGASYTAVNRRITEGRRALRKLERERNKAHPARDGGSGPDTPPPP